MAVDKGKLLSQLLLLVVGQVTLYFTMKWLINHLDPQKEKKDKAALAVSCVAYQPVLREIGCKGFAKIEEGRPTDRARDNGCLGCY